MNGEEILSLGVQLQKIENNEELVKLGKELWSIGIDLYKAEQKRKLQEAEDNFVLPESKEFLGGFEWQVERKNTYYGASWELVGKPVSDEANHFMDSFFNLHKLNGGWSDQPLLNKFLETVMREWFPKEIVDISWPKDKCLRVEFNGYRTKIRASIAFANWLKEFSFATVINRDEIVDSLEKILQEHQEHIAKEFQETTQALDQGLRDLASYTNPLHVFEEVDWSAVINKTKPTPSRITNPKSLKSKKGYHWFVNRIHGVDSVVHVTWTHKTPENLDAKLSQHIAVYRCLNGAVAELVTKENAR